MDRETNLIFEQYKKLNEDLGLGPNASSMVRVTSIGSTTPYRRGAGAPVSDEEHVYIQAGEPETSCGCGDSCGCGCQSDGEYDGELDMARAELLKAADYATKLFNHIANLDSLEGWTAAKITKAADYLSSVYHHLEYEAMDASVEDSE